jgi:hypothetical protein
MRCPYCTTEISAEALVCPQCARDLYLFKPLLAKIEGLEKQLADKTAALSPAYEARIAALEEKLRSFEAPARGAASAATIAGSPATEASGRGYLGSVLLAALPCIGLLVVAHALLLFAYDLPPLYLRIASMLIPIPFGFALLVWHPRRLWISAMAGFFMAAAAVYGMLVVTARMDNVPVLPQDPRDVREVLEYVASIGFAFLTGLLAGKLRHHRLHLAPRPGRLTVFLAQLFTSDAEGHLGIERLAAKIQRLVNAATPAVAGAASVYTGVKALMGDGS